MRACNEQLAADLVARVIGGDERSFDELYRIYGRRVYAFALRSLRDPHEAEQVVIDTMYEVWRRADSFNHACRFTTWLLGIARNKALHVLRARRPGHDDLDAAAELPAPAHEDPYHMVSDRQRRDCLLLGFEALPFEQQQCVQYALVDGLSLSEIARLQDCPENTVKSRLFKARRKLRRSLEEFDGEGHEAACEDDYVTPVRAGTELCDIRPRKLAVAAAE